MMRYLPSRRWVFRGIVLLLGFTLWACSSSGNSPVMASVENSGTDCPVTVLLDADQLPPIDTLPDPFMTTSGERIRSKEQWRCLRQQTLLQLQHYEAGTKPPRPAKVSGSVERDAIVVEVEHNGQQIRFTASVTLPTAGAAPYPAIIGLGASSLNNDFLADQGIAIITVNINALGAQAGSHSRGTGLFYDLYGNDHSASSMTAWAWGVSRLIDVIASSDTALIDPARLGVTGCSRNGKGALLAGAMDERIALSIVQESGAGGAVSWRVAQALADSGINVQTLSHAAGEQPWFKESFGQTFGGNQVNRLPFDHHQLMGMVAPRGLLIFDNTIDWLGPEAAFIATAAAREIYRALGAVDHIAYSENGGHGHCQLPDHQLDLLGAFVQRFLLEEPSETGVLRTTQSHSDEVTRWIKWSAPVLD